MLAGQGPLSIRLQGAFAEDILLICQTQSSSILSLMTSSNQQANDHLILFSETIGCLLQKDCNFAPNKRSKIALDMHHTLLRVIARLQAA